MHVSKTRPHYRSFTKRSEIGKTMT